MNPRSWSTRVLSIVQPLAYAAVTGRAGRDQLRGWAEVLQGVADEMRERAGAGRDGK